MRLSVLLAAALLAGQGLAQAQMQWVEVGEARGIRPFVMDDGMGGGVAAADFDDDDDVDLFVPNAGGVPDQLYRNLSDGTFEEIAAAAGVASIERGRVALWLDYDGDRRLDLLVAADCWTATLVECSGIRPLRLYRQVADAVFVDVTQQSGLHDDLTQAKEHRGGLAAGDLDNDGDLDLLTGLWLGEARLYRNDSGDAGDTIFTEVGAAGGLGGVVRHHWQPMIHDFDGDGWLDIYSAIDFTANRLWLNQGDLSFVDQAPAAGLDNAWNDMGLALGDVDSDGDLDIYVTNIWDYVPGEGRQNELFRNDSVGGVPQFVRTAPEAGVGNGGWGWGTTFLDADLDGDLDLAATNGWALAIDSSKFFLNLGGDPVSFADVSGQVGFDDDCWGSSLIAADLDRDGDLDLVQTCNGIGPNEQPHAVRLLDNQPDAARGAGHYLVVKPRMDGPNHRAIGAVVRLEAGGLNLMRLITAGTSFLGQEPAEAHFGLGAATTVDRLTVEWPGGTTTVLEDIAADRQLVVMPPLFADGFESGDASRWGAGGR